MGDDVKALVEKARLWDVDEVAFDPGAAANLIVKMADALEAATVALAVDRDALVSFLSQDENYVHDPDADGWVFSAEMAAIGLLASGVLRDVRDVQAEGADLAADWLAEQLWPDAADYAGHVRQFAQAIREARNERD